MAGPNSITAISLPQSLPWLALTALQSEEQERRDRVKRLTQQQDAMEGKGFGPPPRDLNVPKYARDTETIAVVLTFTVLKLMNISYTLYTVLSAIGCLQVPLTDWLVFSNKVNVGIYSTPYVR